MRTEALITYCDLVLSLFLGPVDGEVCVSQQLVGREDTVVDSYADTCARVEGFAIQIHWFGNDLEESTRQSCTVGDVVDGLGDNHKLVATDSTDHVARSQSAGETSCDFNEDLVADLMAVDVVDRLEAVDVDEEQGDGGLHPSTAG